MNAHGITVPCAIYSPFPGKLEAAQAMQEVCKSIRSLYLLGLIVVNRKLSAYYMYNKGYTIHFLHSKCDWICQNPA